MSVSFVRQEAAFPQTYPFVMARFRSCTIRTSVNDYVQYHCILRVYPDVRADIGRGEYEPNITVRVRQFEEEPSILLRSEPQERRRSA